MSKMLELGAGPIEGPRLVKDIAAAVSAKAKIRAAAAEEAKFRHVRSPAIGLFSFSDWSSTAGKSSGSMIAGRSVIVGR